MSHFAKNLRFLRLKQELDLATFADHLGIYEESLRRYEREKAEPDLDALLHLAEALKLPVDHLLKRDLELREKKASSRRLRLLLLDVDGTLTDGGMYYSEKGDEMKRFYVKDGMALNRVMKMHGLEVGLISASSTPGLIGKRASILGIDRVYAGKGSKIQVAEAWMEEIACKPEQVAFIGDDLNDISLMKKVGLSACPADASPSVKEIVDLILSKNGGEGCIREFLEDFMAYDL